MEYLKNPIKIKWHITNKCNLRCKFCYLEEYFGKELSIEEINSVLTVIKEKEILEVSLLGGEPTEAKYFRYIIEQLEKIGVYYSFSSNGQTLFQNKELIDFLAQSKYLTEVQISLESPVTQINDSVRGKGTKEKAQKSIKTLTENNIKVCIAMVLTKENKNTIQEMISLAYNFDVDEVRLIPFIPVGTGIKVRERLFMSYEELVDSCSNIVVPKKLKVSTYLSEYSEGTTLGCGAGLVTCVINNDLTLSACPILSQRERSQESFYNVESFDKIWRNSSIFNIWRSGKNNDVMSCNQCPLFYECGGYK